MRSKKALFLAMSGVRIRNERLLALGMTLPGFVERGKVIASLPSLGLLTIAACLPANWDAEYIEVDEFAPGDLNSLAQSDAHLVAISTLPARAYDAYRVADMLREAGKKVVIGGLHASAVPREAAEHADAVVIGEGERVWPRVVEDFERDDLQPYYEARTAAAPVYEFHTAPTPRYDLLDIERYNRLTIQTTRGCPLDCAFCGASRLISPYKRKPIEKVAQELEAILRIWPNAFIELADDNTFVNKQWGRELASLLVKYRVRWFTETDISVADDDSLLELLSESGCAQLLIGLEAVRKESLAEADTGKWKQRKRDTYLDRIRKIQSYGISVNGCFALGFDADGLDVFESTRDFVLESGLSEVQITVLTPFPGTALYQRLKREGRLLQDRFWDRCTLFDVVFKPAQMSVRDLEDGLYWLAKELYDERRTEERKTHFRSCVRSAHRRRNESRHAAAAV